MGRVKHLGGALATLGHRPRPSQFPFTAQLPPPDPAGRTVILYSDSNTVANGKIAANPTGRFLLESGVHLQRTIYARNADILGSAGTALDGNHQNIQCIYGDDGYRFRGWDDDNPTEIYDYDLTANDSTAVMAGPPDGPGSTVPGSWALSDDVIFGFLDIHDCGIANIRPGNHGYMGYVRSAEAYGLCVAGGGLSSSGSPGIIEYCLFERGNRSNVDPGNQGGNSKFVSDWMIVRYCTFRGAAAHTTPSTTPGTTHDDYGLWLDVDVTNFVLHDNIINDIYRAGLIVEISGRGAIYNNTIERVGFRSSAAFTNLWGSSFSAGIQVSASGTGPNTPGDLDIYNNNLTDCYEGIVGYWDPRGHWQRFTTHEHGLQNLYVRNNRIERCGPSGLLYAFALTWTSGATYSVGGGGGGTTDELERWNASHVKHNGKIYRCVQASGAGTNPPTGTTSDNTWWKFQGYYPTDIAGSRNRWSANTYIDVGGTAAETGMHEATTAPFYGTGINGNFPAFSHWQAWGYDAGGSFTGSPGYEGA